MAQAGREKNRDRLRAAIAVAAFHALLGYALIVGLRTEVAKRVGDELKLIDIAPPPPVPELEKHAPARSSTRDPGEAAPPNLSAKATPVVAPPPEVQLEVPPRLVTAPMLMPLDGSDALVGAAEMPGTGTAAGGQGSGTGSGGDGFGRGGGVAARAKLIRGRLRNQDYPRVAIWVRAQGAVSVRYRVATDGKVHDCRVVRSSGNADLDATTCRLIQQRFRYRPALGRGGEPVEETIGKTYEWILPNLPEDPFMSRSGAP